MQWRDFNRWHVAVFFGFAVPIGFALYLQIERVCSISNDLDSRYCTASQAWAWITSGTLSVWIYAGTIAIAIAYAIWGKDESEPEKAERSNRE